MNKHTTLQTGNFIGIALLVSAFLFLWSTTQAHAMECSFERDLDVGMEGEDVLCLQEFLNKAGYTLTESGPGAPGAETKRFGALTREALAKWQEDNDVSPALGYLGPLTRTALEVLGGDSAQEDTESNTDATLPANLGSLGSLEGVLSSLSEGDRKQANELLELFDALGITKTGTTPSGDTATGDEDDEEEESTTDITIGTLMKDTVRMIREAEDAIDDEEVSDEKLIIARDNYNDAREDMLDAVYQYFSGDTEEAYEYAEDAYDNAKDAYEDAGGVTLESEVDDMIDDIEDDLDDAWDDMEDMEDDGEDVDDAIEYLSDAENLLEDAKEAYDDENYEEAEDLVDEVDDLIDDAYDAVVTEEEEDARDALDDADDAIDDARDEIRDALRDGDTVDDAEDYLDTAEDYYGDAKDALDDSDYDNAKDLAEKAEEYADRAIDRL